MGKRREKEERKKDRVAKKVSKKNWQNGRHEGKGKEILR